MSENQSPIQTSIEGCAGVILLSRPEKFNCLSTSVFQGINAALDEFENNSTVRAILLCSTGKHFCTGADLDEVTALLADSEALKKFTAYGHGVLRRMEQSKLPVVAAVQGLCLAGGIELMLGCDVGFAADSARFGDQHAQYGLIPGWGGSQRLPRLAGRRRALDLLFSARWISATEAREWGLINYVVPDAELRSAALEYCQKIGTRSRSGIALMKKLVDQGLDMNIDDGIKLECDLAVPALQSGDVSEGLDAFRNRRTPNFK